jgi:hypothetical protein
MAMSERCDDCLDDFCGGPRFAVIKRNVLTTEEQEAADFSTDPFAKALMLWRQTFVCAACSGWYEDALELTSEDAEYA